MIQFFHLQTIVKFRTFKNTTISIFSSTEQRSPTFYRRPSTSDSGTSCRRNPTFRPKLSRTARTIFTTCRWLTTTCRTWTTRWASCVDREKSIRASASCSLRSRFKLKPKQQKKSGKTFNLGRNSIFINIDIIKNERLEKLKTWNTNNLSDCCVGLVIFFSYSQFILLHNKLVACSVKC